MALMGDEQITVELGPDAAALAPDAQAGEGSPTASAPPQASPSPNAAPSETAPLTPAERYRQLLAQDAELAAEAEHEANARASRTLEKQRRELEESRKREEEAKTRAAQWSEYERLANDAESEDWDTRQKALEALANNERARIQRERFLRDPNLQQALYQDVSVRYFDGMKQALLKADLGVPAEFVEQVWSTEPDFGAAVAKLAAKKYDGWVAPKDVEEQVKAAVAAERARLLGEVPSPDVSRGGASATNGVRGYDAYRRALAAGPEELSKWTPDQIDAAIASRYSRAS